ncbi:MAG: hypothetical protein ABIM88_06565, partial [candidate division WOR-3 bacterium]
MQFSVEDRMRKNRVESEIPFERYKDIGLNQLVVYCVGRILANGEECTLERLIYECFTLFPKKFGLRKYPQWPD